MVQEAERVVGGALKTPVETTENGVGGASEALDVRIKAAHKLVYTWRFNSRQVSRIFCVSQEPAGELFPRSKRSTNGALLFVPLLSIFTSRGRDASAAPPALLPAPCSRSGVVHSVRYPDNLTLFTT